MLRQKTGEGCSTIAWLPDKPISDFYLVDLSTFPAAFFQDAGGN
jgi:hypothetical protein